MIIVFYFALKYLCQTDRRIDGIENGWMDICVKSTFYGKKLTCFVTYT